MGDIIHVFEGVEQIGYEFLLTQVDAANAFLNIAESAPNTDKSWRNVQKARLALSSVDRLRSRMRLDAEQERQLVVAQELLQARLSRSEPLIPQPPQLLPQ